MASPSEPTHILYPPAVLRLDPRALPTVRAAFAEALDLLGAHLEKMQQEAVITEDWLGDEDSRGLRDFYNQQIMYSPHGPFSAMLNYKAVLQRVHDELATTEAEYRRVEGENSELWGRA